MEVRNAQELAGRESRKKLWTLSSVEQLEYVLKNYCEHYRHERIHQSLGRIMEPIYDIDENAEIVCINVEVVS